MDTPGRAYRRSEMGQNASADADSTLSVEHRRILDLIEGDTHCDVIRGCLRRFSDAQLAGWLAEMEQSGWLISAPADATQDIAFTAFFQHARPGAAAIASEDLRYVESLAHAAGYALSRKGAYLCADRLRNRAALEKPAARTVVLIVKDDPDQPASSERRLSVAGYPVRWARSRKQLVEDFQAYPLPDLVLLDAILPDGDGTEILTSVRRHPRLALLPVVMLTAKADPENVRKGFAVGVDGYITKPCSTKILAATFRDVLKHA